MSFWSNIKSAATSFASSVKSGAKKAASWVGEKLENAGRALQDAISELGKSSDGPTIDWTPTPPSASSSVNEDLKKAEIQRENEAITRYQTKVQTKASKRETKVKKAYLKTYSTYIAAFSEIFDKDIIVEINKYVNNAAGTFANTLRDEINTKVSPSYQPWKQLVSQHPSEKQLQEYCDNVFKEADNNLLDLFQEVIEDTNKFISQCVVKYNDDRARALSEMKDSLIKLTSDEETKAQELKKIAEELAVVSYIAHESSKDI